MSLSGPTFTCGIALCHNVTSIGCTGPEASLECKCFSDAWYGPDCTFNTFSDLPSAFYGLQIISLLIMLTMTILGVYLLILYLTRYRAALPESMRSLLNAHFLTLFFVALASFIRLLRTISVLAIGYNFERIYYLKASAMHAWLRLGFGCFFPLIAAAYTMQVLLWLDVIITNVRYKAVGRATWFWVTFMLIFACGFILEFVVQALLTTRATSSASVLRAYQALLTAYSVVLLIITLIFGFRFAYISKRMHPDRVPNMRLQEQRINLNRMVIGSAINFISIIVVLIIRLTLQPNDNLTAYFVPRFFQVFLEGSLCALIFLTIHKMIRNHLDFPDVYAADEERKATSIGLNDQSDLRVPLVEQHTSEDIDYLNKE